MYLATERRILVVDLNLTDAEIFGMLLRTYGYDVRIACSIEDALLVVKNFLPDVVMCDVDTPYLRGYWFARQIRDVQSPYYPCMIATSIWRNARKVAKSLHAGFDMHFSKPYEATRLRNALNDYFSPRSH